MRYATVALVFTTLLCLTLLDGVYAQDGGSSDSSTHLTVKIAVAYKMGGAQPVSGTGFYLLKAEDDPRKILAREYDLPWSETGNSLRIRTAQQVERENQQKRRSLEVFLSTVGEGDKTYSVNYYRLGRAKIAKAAVAYEKTDHGGGVTFGSIDPGQYWIFGFATARDDSIILWNKKVHTSESVVNLDQGDAAMMISPD